MEASISRQAQQIAGVVLVIVVLGAGQYWLWDFVREKAVGLHALRTAEQQERILEERLVEVRSSQTQWENAQPQLGIIFPPQGNTTQVVERLEEAAAQTGVRLDVSAIDELSPIAPDKGDSKFGLVPLVVNLEVTAPIERLLAYIDRVEHVPEATRIWQYEVVPADPPEEGAAQPDQELFRLTMRIAFYLQKGGS